MRKIIIYIIFSMSGIISAQGQNKNTLVQRINEIKNQSEIYYWDQYTWTDADTSKVNATKRLLLDINIGREANELLSVEEIMSHAKYINIDRGNMKQCFVYIKKTEADVIKKGGNNTNIHVDAGVSTNPSPSLVTAPAPKAFVPDAFVQRVMETKNFMNVYNLLKSSQAQGQVLQFGKLKDVEDYSSLELILFDMQSQEVITLLSGVTSSGHRKNLVNGTDDSLDNYPTNMTAVIWYIKK